MDQLSAAAIVTQRHVGTCVEIKLQAPHAIDATYNHTHWLISTQVGTINNPATGSTSENRYADASSAP